MGIAGSVTAYMPFLRIRHSESFRNKSCHTYYLQAGLAIWKERTGRGLPRRQAPEIHQILED
jgi:hypothetical protein